MRKLALAALAPLAAVALALGIALAQEAPAKGEVRVRWFGQACFELDFPTGLVVLCDPFDTKIGSYAFPKDVTPDVVTISHEHFDHANDKDVAGKPEVLRGLTGADAKTHDWQKHDVVRKGVRIRSVGVFHDAADGKQRGKNAVFVFEPEEKGAFATIAHLGDLGHVLTDEQAKAIGHVDGLLVPVGGSFTIDAAAAKKVCDQLGPERVVVPMHFKTAALAPKIPLVGPDAFLELWKGVERPESNEVAIAAGEAKATRVVLLEWKKRESTDMKKTIRGGRAWVNAQPGATKPELNLSLEIDYEVPAGTTFGARATIGKSSIALEDEDGKKLAASGNKIAPKGKIVLHAVAGQSAKVGDEVELEWTFEPPAGKSGSAKDTGSTKIPVQDVR